MTTTHQAKLDRAIEMAQARYAERDGFFSDSDLLEIADELAPMNYEAVEAGDLAAICAEAEHRVLVEDLYTLIFGEEEAI
jgi:hypothetical protein